jgi:hypothetical protein
MSDPITNLADATAQAIKDSIEHAYAAIILSNGFYHVEVESGIIRVWEELIAEYENGELVTQ